MQRRKRGLIRPLRCSVILLSLILFSVCGLLALFGLLGTYINSTQRTFFITTESFQIEVRPTQQALTAEKIKKNIETHLYNLPTPTPTAEPVTIKWEVPPNHTCWSNDPPVFSAWEIEVILWGCQPR